MNNISQASGVNKWNIIQHENKQPCKENIYYINTNEIPNRFT